MRRLTVRYFIVTEAEPAYRTIRCLVENHASADDLINMIAIRKGISPLSISLLGLDDDANPVLQLPATAGCAYCGDLRTFGELEANGGACNACITKANG